MNTFSKISAAVALGLALMGANMSCEAAGRTAAPAAKTIYLGTVTVTAADAEGTIHAKAPTTAYLGQVNVTANDSLEARAAEQSARRHGDIFLGTVVVTPADSTEARYAAANAARQSGTAFLGTVTVTPRNATPQVVGELLAELHRLPAKALFAVVGALVFARMGG